MTSRIQTTPEITDVQETMTDEQVELLAESFEDNPVEDEPISLFDEIEFTSSSGEIYYFRTPKNFKPKIRTIAEIEALSADPRYSRIFTSSFFYIVAVLSVVQVEDTAEEYRARGAKYLPVDINKLADLDTEDFAPLMTQISNLEAIKEVIASMERADQQVTTQGKASVQKK